MTCFVLISLPSMVAVQRGTVIILYMYKLFTQILSIKYSPVYCTGELLSFLLQFVLYLENMKKYQLTRNKYLKLLAELFVTQTDKWH